MKKIFLLIIIVICLPLGIALADTAYDLPEIQEPTKPGAMKISHEVRAFLSDGPQLYHVRGRVTGLHDGKIWIDEKGFLPSETIEYFSESKKRLFPSDIRVGNDAGLILNSLGEIIQMWRIEAH